MRAAIALEGLDDGRVVVVMLLWPISRPYARFFSVRAATCALADQGFFDGPSLPFQHYQFNLVTGTNILRFAGASPFIVSLSSVRLGKVLVPRDWIAVLDGCVLSTFRRVRGAASRESPISCVIC